MARAEPDLSFIQPNINLKDVSRLDSKKIIHLTNEFLMRVADISNSFMGKMENKILEIERRIEALDTELTLVESKLDSVHIEAGSESISASKEVVVTPEISEVVVTPSVSMQETAPEISNASPEERELKQVIVEGDKPDSDTTKVSEHPEYMKYFKMLKFGIPETAVKQKMSSEGVDPTLLDNPNAAVPHSTTSPNAVNNSPPTDDSGSDSSFSSSSSG